MSVVPPSPPWAMTRTSGRPLTFQRRRDARRHGSGVAEQRMDPGNLPGSLRVRRREHLEAAGGIRGNQLPGRRLHRRIDCVARAQRLAAALAGAVTGVQGIRAAHVGLHRALLGRQQPVAHREGAGLVELDRLPGHVQVPQPIFGAARPMSRRMLSAMGPERRTSRSRATTRSTIPDRDRGTSAARARHSLRLREHPVQRLLRDRRCRRGRR